MSIFLAKEKSTARWSAVLKDHTGAAIANSAINAAALTLFNLDDDTKSIINSRDAVDIIGGSGGTGANGFTFDASGNIVWTMTPEDNAIIDTAKGYERHQANIEITYDTNKKLKFEIEIIVENKPKIT